MRPHRLRVTAFGAFGGTVEVSFDDLASSGLFLLHGETGAGKTTLLDAIGFALYGRVPGERGKARRLRSDHAAPGTPTEVQLEATIGGRGMRITGKPEQERAKLRGTGTTTEQAKVLLEEFTGASWQAVSTRAGEADTEIADLMGMSADQFFQVVLLPQGEFARFLHADAGDRAKLLQRLFGTDRFHAGEERLARRRKATAGEARAAAPPRKGPARRGAEARARAGAAPLAGAGRPAAAVAGARAAEAQARTKAQAGAEAAGLPPAATAAELRAAGQQQVAQVGRLEALRSLSRQAADEDEAAASAHQAADVLAAQIDAAGREAAARRQRRPGLSRERDEASGAGQRLPAVRAQADRSRPPAPHAPPPAPA